MTVAISTNSRQAATLLYLRNMFGDSRTWRALVEAPNVAWSTLEELITAGTSSQANALAKIKYGGLEDKSTHSNFVEVPRMSLRHPESDDAQRLSASGFLATTTVIAVFEFPVPDLYKANYEDLYVDFLNKIGGILGDVELLPRQYPYADISRIQLDRSGEIDPKSNNNRHWTGGEALIECRGGSR